MISLLFNTPLSYLFVGGKPMDLSIPSKVLFIIWKLSQCENYRRRLMFITNEESLNMLSLMQLVCNIQDLLITIWHWLSPQIELLKYLNSFHINDSYVVIPHEACNLLKYWNMYGIQCANRLYVETNVVWYINA